MADNTIRYKTLVDFSRILSLFEAREAGERSVTDIARSLDMLPSKASRILKTLEAEELLERDRQTGRYRVGVRFLLLGLVYLQNHPLRRIILPHVEQIAVDLGVYASWGVFANDGVVVIDRMRLDRIPPIHLFGAGLPLHASAYGKLLLAYLPEEGQKAVLSTIDFERFTDRTIVDPEALKVEIDRTKANGYAVDEGESREGVLSISFPIFDDSSEAVAAINVLGEPSVDNMDRARTISYLREKAVFISRQLGYAPAPDASLIR